MTDSRPRKRRRPALACEQCRQRKVRCDHAFPCGPCTRARHAMPCSYSPLDEAANNTRSSSLTAQDSLAYSRIRTTDDELDGGPAGSSLPLEQTIRGLQNRVQRLEQLVLADRESTGKLPAHNGISSQPLHGLEDRVSNIERQLTNNAAGLGDQDTCILAPPLRMKTSPEKTKVAGQSHWGHAAQQLHLLNKIKPQSVAPTNDGQAVEMREAFNKCKGLRTTIKGRQSATWNEPFQNLVNDLPLVRDVCTEMVDAYFRTLGPIYRILHSLFRQRYTMQFLPQPESVSHSFMLKTLLVIAIGSVFHSDPKQRSHVRQHVRRWVYAAQWWLTGPSEKSAHNLDGLQVFCLMLLCRLVHSLNKESVWVAAGSLVRFACSLGLHRDPRHFPSLSVFECETRRRLWATVMELVMQSSFDVSMPPLISEDDYDTKPPLNIDDRDIDEDTQRAPPPKPDSQFTDTSVQTLLLQSLPTRLQAARYINQFQWPQSYENALRLGSQLTTSCRELATFFQIHQFSESPGFHHKILDTHLRRIIVFLYRPFAIQALHDPRFYLSRKLSLESAMVMASYAESMNLPSEPLDDFAKLSITGSGTFKGPLSLDTIIVICLELTTQLEEESKARPRPQTGSTPTTPDILDKMVQATRRPLVEILEHIQEQLLQAIGLGIPSMKRHAVISAVLGQTKAMHRTGQCRKQAIHDVVVECVKKCTTILERYIESTSFSPSSGGNVIDEWTPIASDFGVDSWLQGFGIPWDDFLVDFPAGAY